MTAEAPGGEADFADKFVAFIDILGFKSMVELAEAGRGRSLADIHELVLKLKCTGSRRSIEKHGPTTCPGSKFIEKGLQLELTQVTDCSVISAEVSPAGLINLVSLCWEIALELLFKGVLVRGYIVRGKIYHKNNVIIGTGYQVAYERERGVDAFKTTADEIGTPFVEIDPAVADYALKGDDKCVSKMFKRLTREDGGTTAIFPFGQLSHGFIIDAGFDAAKERANNEVVRQLLTDLTKRLTLHVDKNNKSAMRKVSHYVRALQEQLQVCDTVDEHIRIFDTPMFEKK